MNRHPLPKLMLATCASVPLLLVLTGSIGQKQDQSLKPGERRVENGIIEVSGNRYEIDGVCKFGEDSATCWKPDGTPNNELSDRLTNSIRHPRSNNSRTYTVTFLKKKRFLVLKHTRLNQSNLSGNFPSNRDNYGQLKEGWSGSSSSGFSASYRDFDGSEIDWNVIEGTFEPETREFPLRYEFETQSPNLIKLRLELGKFEVDGNLFEIKSILDHPRLEPGKQDASSYYNPYQAPARTDVIIHAVSIVNPYSSFTLNVADEAGNPYAYVDKDAKPVSIDTANKWDSENLRYTQDKPQPKCPYMPVGNWSFNAKYEPPTNFDRPCYFGITKDKCKNILISSSARTVYVFEHVKLDPN